MLTSDNQTGNSKATTLDNYYFVPNMSCSMYRFHYNSVTRSIEIVSSFTLVHTAASKYNKMQNNVNIKIQ